MDVRCRDALVNFPGEHASDGDGAGNKEAEAGTEAAEGSDTSDAATATPAGTGARAHPSIVECKQKHQCFRTRRKRSGLAKWMLLRMENMTHERADGFSRAIPV